MNYSTAIFLINDQARAMQCAYEPEGKLTTFKTLDPTIDVDDLVIVETDTRHGFTVCQVVEADVDIDLGTYTEIRWIVDRIDMARHEDLAAQEKEAIKAIKSAEIRKKREEMREALFKDHTETLKELEIANMQNGIKQIECAPEGKAEAVSKE